jgi:hypothetical protein
MGRKRNKSRVLLDSNIWRSLADNCLRDELRRHSIKFGVDIQIAPAVVYEALRTKNYELRKALITVMTDARWTRLMPEAYEECQELLSEK